MMVVMVMKVRVMVLVMVRMMMVVMARAMAQVCLSLRAPGCWCRHLPPLTYGKLFPWLAPLGLLGPVTLRGIGEDQRPLGWCLMAAARRSSCVSPRALPPCPCRSRGARTRARAGARRI